MSGFVIGLLKNFVTGILAKALKEAVLSIIGKLKWKFMIERFLTRLVRKCLVSLSKKSHNLLSEEDVDKFLGELKEKGLPAAEHGK